MALTGTYLRTLDKANRLAIPKRLRKEFSTEAKTKDVSSLYVAPGTEKSLALYSPAAFERLAERLASRPSNQQNVRNYLRMFYARAEQVDFDSQGRIRLPERLADFANLDHDVVLLGVHDHAEIWDSKQWDTFLSQHEADYDDLATTAFE